MENLNKYVEHTLLKQDATKEDFKKLFNEAKEYNFLGVCINPCYVKFAKEELQGSDIKVVTVIGFPLGANTTDTKVFETKKAISDGADEIDMVINVTKIKDKESNFIINEIKQIKTACKYAIQGGANFVKTSTGFVKNGVGAKVEDVELMYNTVKDYGLKVKASGGIRDKQKAIDMIKSGATRLGTSSGVKICESELIKK